MKRLLLTMFILAQPIVCGADDNTRSTSRPKTLTDADVERLLNELQPSAKQLWRQIPWKISVLDGQRTAAQQNKPIFIWAMDGHPLGCT